MARQARLGRAATAHLPGSAGFLNGRTGHIAVGAEHAAIAFQRAQDRITMPTIIEKLTGIGRHCFGRYAAALGASQGRLQLGHKLSNHACSGASNNSFHATDNRMNAVAALRSRKVDRDGASTAQLALLMQSCRLRT